MAGKKKMHWQATRTTPDLATHSKPAFRELLSAWDGARDVDSDPWEFAVEIGELASLGLGRSDLRWLMKKGYAAHAREVTRPGDASRRFQPELSLAFTSKTCFILTDAGHSLLAGEEPVPTILRLHEALAATPAAASLVPHWDPRSRTLCLGDRIVKHYRVPAGNQEALLSAFEEEGWAKAIDDPLPPSIEVCPGVRLRDTVRRLNANQANPLLHFYGDGTGERVLWEMLAPRDPARQALRRAA